MSSSEAIYFLEGYLKATLKDGKTAESIRGLGMTLMGPMKSDVPLESNMWNWTWSNTSGGEGVLKYNIPLLDEGETQSVETSQATGMSEVNGLQVGDRVTLQNETVVNTSNFPQDIVQELFPNGSSVFSDPVTFVVEDASKYPKTITVGEEEPVQEQKNVALAKYVTSDGKTTASQTVSWPKSQASVDFTPATLAGYSVSPASHTFTKDGEMVTFTYTPNTMDTVADSDVTVIVDYKVPDGYTAPASKKATGKPKTSYSVLTPDIYGLAPSKRVVEGVFSNQNENFTVTYVKTETGMLLDDKTVFCPPDRVFVYDGTARQLIPYSPGYTFEGSSSEVFPGIYTYQLKLNAGWKWSDGTTGTKSVTCAIDKAPLSSVRVSQNQFKDTDGIT